MSDDADEPNRFLNIGCDIDNMGLEDDSPRYRDTDTVMPDRPQKEHPALECKESLFAASQETPPDVAFTEPPSNIISPNTILATASRAFAGGPATKAPKKGRKRGRSKVFATQPVPEKTIPIKDMIARNARKYHVSGTPSLPPAALEHTTGDLLSLHNVVLSTEQSIILCQCNIQDTRFSWSRCPRPWDLS